jgi:hypothetical protein
MAIFPALLPGTRTYSPGEFPHSAHRVYDGSEARVRHSNTVLGVRLRLFFPAISSADLLTVIAHYSGQRGRFLPFAIPVELLSGVDTPADFTPEGLQWRYAAKPTVEDISITGASPSNVHNLTVELETVPPENTIIAGARLRMRATIQGGSPQLGAFLEVEASVSGGEAVVQADLSMAAFLEGGEPFPVVGLEVTATIEGGAVVPDNTGPFTVRTTVEGGAATGTVTDPNYADVSLLLPMNGTNGSTTFTDASPNAFTITANGNAQISTAQNKWGGSSGLFDGTGDFLATPTNTDFDITASGTVELWFYQTVATGGNRTLIHVHAGGANGLHIYVNSDRLLVDNGLAADFTSGAGVIDLNTWHFIQVTISGTTLKIWCDGVELSSRTAQSYGTPDRCRVGRYSTGGVTADAAGHINDLRITKGVVRASAVPTAAFPTS